MCTGLDEAVSERRARLVRGAREMGPILARANWWIARAGAEEALVLGDHPVVTTVSLGHDDNWRPILGEGDVRRGDASRPSRGIGDRTEGTGPRSPGLNRPTKSSLAINRLDWRSADRYVLARDRDHLDQALPNADEELRRSTIPMDLNLGKITNTAMAETAAIVAGVRLRMDLGPWQNWQRHRLRIGYAPFATEDRDQVHGPAHGNRPKRGSAGRRRPKGGRSNVAG